MKKIFTAIAFNLLSALAVSAQDWPADPPEGWAQLVEAAREEGPVVIAAQTPNEAIFEQYSADTGLDYVLVPGGRGEVNQRFTREVETGNMTIDVHLGGANPIHQVVAGRMHPIGDDLVLAEVTDGANWRGGALEFVDTEARYMPMPSQYRSGAVLINSNLVDAETLTTWDQLMSGDFAGQIVMHVVSRSGAGLAAASYLAEVKGRDFMENMVREQDITFAGEYRQIVDMVARGNKAVGLAALPVHIERYRNEGIDSLEVIFMEDAPGYLVGGSSVVSVGKNRPRPNATKVFVNWYLSQSGQTAFSNAIRVPSNRTDVSDGPWPSYIEPGDQQGLLDQYEQEWYLSRRPAARALIKELLEN